MSVGRSGACISAEEIGSESLAVRPSPRTQMGRWSVVGVSWHQEGISKVGVCVARRMGLPRAVSNGHLRIGSNMAATR